MPRPLATIEPPGTLRTWAGPTTPEGYLLADGSAVSTTTYAALFAAIGYQYGGSGGTFNLPDAREKATMNQNPSGLGGLSVRTRGSTVGSNSHSLASTEVPRHYHTLAASSGHNISHAHTFYFYNAEAVHAHSPGVGSHAHTHAQTYGDSYSPYWYRWDQQGYANCCVYTQCACEAATAGIAGQTASGTHSHYHLLNGSSSGGSSQGHTHTGTTGSLGGTAHSNVGPSVAFRLVVKY